VIRDWSSRRSFLRVPDQAEVDWRSGGLGISLELVDDLFLITDPRASGSPGPPVRARLFMVCSSARPARSNTASPFSSHVPRITRRAVEPFIRSSVARGPSPLLCAIWRAALLVLARVSPRTCTKLSGSTHSGGRHLLRSGRVSDIGRWTDLRHAESPISSRALDQFPSKRPECFVRVRDERSGRVCWA